MSGTTHPKKGAPPAGTLAWLIERYRESSRWRSYSLATRRQRENIFKQVITTAGTTPVSKITEAVIVAGRERRKVTPFQARHFIDAMRGLFAWAVEAGHAKTNPATNVKYVAVKSGHTGFPVWTEDDVAAYEAHWSLGTRQRVWLAVLLFTGLRRGDDAVWLGRQHVRNGVAVIKTEKTGQTVADSDLGAAGRGLGRRTDRRPRLHLRSEREAPDEGVVRQPLFSSACREAGVGKAAHGLRKIGVTRAANNGASVAQLNAIFGLEGWPAWPRSTPEVRRSGQRLAGEVMNKMLPHETENVYSRTSGKGAGCSEESSMNTDA